MSRISAVQRNTAIVASVVLLHVGALWALQTGLLRRAVEVFVPAEVISERLEPTPPRPLPAPSVPPPPVKTAPSPAPVSPPAPTPVPAPMSEPVAANAPVVPAAPAPAVTAAPVATPAVAAKVELPSSDAQYLNNPPPNYPAISQRRGEQGTVVVRVLIGANGTAQKAQIQQSSSYERLDQAALNTVLSWRYVPGKRGGVPEAMWFDVPVKFEIR